ncbi:MAG: 50S ribosomal protein L11 methyltransferase [Candidatus Rokubacteria bacterium]|nr:50S ribosomal protein L11 methyltransferase [Candidatus Rokubacteria bacterium]
MPFWELALPASPETSEGLTNFLWELGALGVIEEEANGAPARLRAFFAEGASPAALLSAVDAYAAALKALGFAVATREPTVTPLVAETWADAWRQSFPARAVGRRLLVAPPWEIPASLDGRQLVVIEPRRAFGTSNHGSTQGCLTLLDAFLESHRASHGLDLGTGTGILAIAALLLGVPAMMALDIDPDALRETRENAERNGVADRLRCELGGPEGLEGSTPLLLANLLAGAHAAFGAHYRRLVVPEGSLIVGGLLTPEEPGVVDALSAHGFRPVERVELEGWVSLRLTTAP